MTPDLVLRGVATVAGQWLAPRMTGHLEVTRTATDGTPNAGSALYAVAWRAAKALGYRRLVTRNQERERRITPSSRVPRHR